MAPAAPFSRALTRLHRRPAPIPSFSDLPPNPSSRPFSSSSAPPISSPLDSSPSLSSSQSQGKERGRWTRWLLFAPGVITFGLGTWQLFRRQEKMKMLDYRQKRLEMDPIRWNDISPASNKLESMEFRRILLKGVFDEKKSIFVGPRARSISGVTENGYYLITPLMPIPGDPESMQSPVLVNRGWVPRTWKEKYSEFSKYSEQPSDMKRVPVQESTTRAWWTFWAKKPKQIEDRTEAVNPIEVVGVIRGSEKPSIFVPANDPNSNQWFYVDVPAMSRKCGFTDTMTYIEDINENVNPSCPYPVPKDADSLIRSSVMPLDHLNYTLTWYSLSAAVTFMAYKRIMPKSNPR